MKNDDVEFTPEQVEQQIDMLVRSHQSWFNSSSNTRLIADLYQVSAEENATLENAWQRLEERIGTQVSAAENATQQTRSQRNMPSEQRKRPQNMQSEEKKARSPRKMQRFLQMCAALLIVAALVGGSTIMIHTLRQNNATQLTTTPTPMPASLEAGIYFTTPDGIYRQDLRTGKILWHYSVEQSNANYPPTTVIDSTVIAQVESAQTTYLVGIDTATGKKLWKTGEKVGTNFLLASGDLLLTSSSVKQGIPAIIAYNARTGKTVWSHTLAQTPSNMKIANGALYLIDGSQVVALQSSSGDLIWSKTLPAPFEHGWVSSDITVSGKRLYFSDNLQSSNYSQHRWLLAVDATNGHMLWHVGLKYVKAMAVTGAGPGPIVIGDTVYISGTDNGVAYTYALSAYNANSGALLWDLPQHGTIIFQPVALQNLLVYLVPVSNEAVKLVAFNTTTQTIAWSKDVKAKVDAFPVHLLEVINDVIYISAYPQIMAYTMTGKQLQTYSSPPVSGNQQMTYWNFQIIA